MKFPAFILALAFAIPVFAQNNAANAGVDLRKRGFVDNFFQKKADSLNLENVSGSPYIADGYRLGRIVLKSRKAFDSVAVRFNAYNNEINFIQDGQKFAIDEAYEVSYYDVPGDSSTLMVFRSGYPAIDKQATNTYYQLVAGGNDIHLIKLIRKTLQEFKVDGTGMPVRKELVTHIAWYIYSEKDGMHPVSSSRKSIEKALPSFTTAIDKLAGKHDLNLKKDDDMIRLIELLDAM
jgi:hypothetical protein